MFSKKLYQIWGELYQIFDDDILILNNHNTVVVLIVLNVLIVLGAPEALVLLGFKLELYQIWGELYQIWGELYQIWGELYQIWGDYIKKDILICIMTYNIIMLGW